MLYARHILDAFQASLSFSPVVLLNGARQTGKSTLVQTLVETDKYQYFSMDDPTVLGSAAADPKTFIDDLPEFVILDEIQRSPELFLSIKNSVDKNRAAGRFVLTGSANVLVLPKLSESLAGRMLIRTLWPLSQGEIAREKEKFMDSIWVSSRKKFHTNVDWEQLVSLITIGGFPELVASGADHKLIGTWFDSYLRSLLERDVRDISNIDGLRLFPFLLSILANRTGKTLNYADIAGACKIPKTSVVRYMNLLEAMFLLITIPAWFTNAEKRLIKSPKLYFSDTGLLCRLMNIGTERLLKDRSSAGFIMENFVAMELIKQLSWSDISAKLYHYRTHDGQEVDFVLERDDGSLIGIEVKCSSSVSRHEFQGLKHLANAAPKQFIRGIVLYTGNQTLSFAENLQAIPISALWQNE